MNKEIKKGIASGLITFTLLTGGCGPGPAEKPVPQATSGEVVPGADSIASAAETTKSTEVNPELALAPDIAGLNKEIINDKVTYMSKEGNTYGLEANSYAGEFKKEVTVEGTETGGVALVPKVAQKLLTDALTQIPESQNKIKVIVPLDITNADSSGEIEIYSALSTKVNQNMLFFKFKGQLPFINQIPGENNFVTTANAINLDFKSDKMDFSVQNLGEVITDKLLAPVDKKDIMKHFYFIIPRDSVSTSFSAPKSTFGENLNFRVNSLLIMSCRGETSNIVSLNTSDILRVNNSPVFLATTPTGGK